MRRAARDMGRDGSSIVERMAQMSLDDLAIEAEMAEASEGRRSRDSEGEANGDTLAGNV